MSTSSRGRLQKDNRARSARGTGKLCNIVRKRKDENSGRQRRPPAAILLIPRPRATALILRRRMCARGGRRGGIRGAPQRRRAVRATDADGLAAAPSEPICGLMAAASLLSFDDLPVRCSCVTGKSRRAVRDVCAGATAKHSAACGSPGLPSNKLGGWRRGKSFVSGSDSPRNLQGSRQGLLLGFEVVALVAL